MIRLTTLIPTSAAFVLGLVYFVTGEGGPRMKGLIVVVFLVAAYLQFMTQYSLVGMLLQVTLALALAIWWKLENAV
ncbi:MAG TPA: hypothetical protein VJV75_07150 [Candidatus Polarisedimenticolia bacterium]|nr:hypothetical protein [Candidatus Polarisedimenticolia bacterium]